MPCCTSVSAHSGTACLPTQKLEIAFRMQLAGRSDIEDCRVRPLLQGHVRMYARACKLAQVLPGLSKENPGQTGSPCAMPSTPTQACGHQPRIYLTCTQTHPAVPYTHLDANLCSRLHSVRPALNGQIIVWDPHNIALLIASDALLCAKLGARLTDGLVVVQVNQGQALCPKVLVARTPDNLEGPGLRAGCVYCRVEALHICARKYISKTRVFTMHRSFMVLRQLQCWEDAALWQATE